MKVLFGRGTFCHVMFDCSSGSAIISLVHSLEPDSLFLHKKFKQKPVSIITSSFCSVGLFSGIFFIISARPFCLQSLPELLYFNVQDYFRIFYVQRRDPVFLLRSCVVSGSNTCPERLTLMQL